LEATRLEAIAVATEIGTQGEVRIYGRV